MQFNRLPGPFGVEAPEVRPSAIGPVAGSHARVVTSVEPPTGRWRISSGEIRHCGSAM